MMILNDFSHSRLRSNKDLLNAEPSNESMREYVMDLVNNNTLFCVAKLCVDWNVDRFEPKGPTDELNNTTQYALELWNLIASPTYFCNRRAVLLRLKLLLLLLRTTAAPAIKSEIFTNYFASH